MKKSILGLVILLSLSRAYSQKLYFVYLQTDPEQAFFLKMNDKVHNSSSSGYLILSRLGDSIYTFSVGFPKNKWPEQKFTVAIKSKDHGYYLKNFGDKGWGLFDMETLGVQMGSKVESVATMKTEPKQVSIFTDVLSKAANDPSLKERPVAVAKEEKVPVQPPSVAKETPKDQGVAQQKDQGVVQQDIPAKKDNQPVVKEAAVIQQRPADNTDKNAAVVVNREADSVKEQPALKQDSSLVKKEDTIQQKTKEDAKTTSEYKLSVITKKSETNTADGLSVTFIDDYGNGKKDTVGIIIPGVKKDEPETKAPQKQRKFLDIFSSPDESSKAKKTDSAKLKTDAPVAATSAQKTRCPALATESDFLKLRKKMANVTTGEDNMVDEARKAFKLKCYSVEQVKNLSTLFAEDSGRYKLFDAVYQYVSDPEIFSSLSIYLKDPYYLNRFNAMLR